MTKMTMTLTTNTMTTMTMTMTMTTICKTKNAGGLPNFCNLSN